MEAVFTCMESEETHGLKVKRNLGSPIHQQKSWQSLVIYNSKRAGFTTPLRLRKPSSPRLTPTNYTPFSKKFQERFPEAVQLHNQRFNTTS